MKLLTKEIIKRFETIGRQEESSDPIVVAKFFTPDSSCTWYATEFEPESGIFFGWANLGDPTCAEFGSFALSELESVRGRLGLPVERDRHCGEKPLSEHQYSGFAKRETA